MWIIPSGTVESGETSAKAAVREVEEEAGLACKIERKVGVFADDHSVASTSIYIMSVLKDHGKWEDQHKRQRKWFPLSEAVAKLKPRDQGALKAYLSTL